MFLRWYLVKYNAFTCVFPVIGFSNVWFGKILFLGFLFLIFPLVGKGWQINLCLFNCSSCIKKDRQGLWMKLQIRDPLDRLDASELLLYRNFGKFAINKTWFVMSVSKLFLFGFSLSLSVSVSQKSGWSYTKSICL